MLRSPFELFIKGTPDGADVADEKSAPSTRLLTPANLMTAARPELARRAAKKIMAGEPGALRLVILMAASDMEGKVARLCDTLVPDLEIGTSFLGEKGDTYADFLGLATVTGSILLSPWVAKRQKPVTAAICAQEGYKAQWALRANATYRRQTGAKENLYIPPTPAAKAAMADKFAGVVLTVAALEAESTSERAGLEVMAGFYGMQGVRRAHGEIRGYQQTFAQMMAEHHRDSVAA